MDEITFIILKFVVTVCITLITLYLIPFLMAQLETKKYEELYSAIEVAVKAAEQTLEKGSEKKTSVIWFIKTWLAGRGIEITDDQLDRLIEAAVYQIKSAKSN